MRVRQAVLFLLVTLPGLAAVLTCGYYLFQDWSALISAFARFEKAAASGADLRSLYIAGTLDQVYRINAFADGVGVMLGAVLFGIGVHGHCAQAPEPADFPSRLRLLPAAGAAAVVICTVLVLGSLANRVGHTNSLRRAVIRGDVPMVRELIAHGADPRDRLWWGKSALDVAREEQGPRRGEVLRALQ